ncbi:alpha-amylase [Clonorchis sinensis]|uniref:Alpha-amylase n=1 Tax=Clonorchis sinensis TaxID=79923 RepID=G7YHJ9_CLOSI|nr:alpha-amylase [Clonorchis sinensis]
MNGSKSLGSYGLRFLDLWLLAVDPGDCGYGLSDSVDKAIDFLGTKDHPAAHMVISRQFVEHRGWKEQPSIPSWQEITIRSYHPVTSNAKTALALTTATPSDHRHGDMVALASIFLLPGMHCSQSFRPHMNGSKSLGSYGLRFLDLWLLAVDPGDCGYGLSDSVDKAIDFLGTKDHPAAHMVISRQCLAGIGTRVPNPKLVCEKRTDVLLLSGY